MVNRLPILEMMIKIEDISDGEASFYFLLTKLYMYEETYLSTPFCWRDDQPRWLNPVAGRQYEQFLGDMTV